MRRMKSVVITIIALVTALAACAPGASPSLTPASPQAAPSPATGGPTAVAAPRGPGLDEIAWQRIVDAARKEGSVTLYSFHFVGDTGIALQRAFQQRYGIKVDIITGRGAEFIERLRTEARSGNRVGDYMQGSAAHLVSVKRAGLSAPIAADLPALREKGVWKQDPTVLDKEGHLLATVPAFMQPYINTRLVKAEDEPRAWADLPQPKWKGKILFNDPMVSSTPYIIFQPLIRAGVLPEDYLKKLGSQEPVFVTGGVQGIERLSRGEAPVYAATSSPDAAQPAREGAPIKVIDFKEGITALYTLQGVIANAPHPNAARVFANWWLTKEGQAVFASAKGSDIIRTDVQPGLPASINLKPATPVHTTPEDLDTQARLFQEKAWVRPLKEGK